LYRSVDDGGHTLKFLGREKGCLFLCKRKEQVWDKGCGSERAALEYAQDWMKG